MALEYGAGGDIQVTLEGPFGNAGESARLTEIFLPASGWKGADSPYAQAVTVEGVSVNSKVDLQPSPAQLLGRRLALMAENDQGVVTVYALGDKPEGDLLVQATLTEVVR